MKNEALSFFDNETEKEMLQRQEIVDAASSEGKKVSKLETTGRFLMECATYAYKKDKEFHVSPKLWESEKKGSLILTINLKVVDGTPTAPKGASIYHNIVLSPARGANDETHRNVANFMKPKISALIGTDRIYINSKWIDEWLLASFEEKDGKLILCKDHKMKQKVMVTVEERLYENEVKYDVTSIVRAKENDKSVADVNPIVNIQKQEIAEPSHNEFDKKSETTKISDDSDPIYESQPDSDEIVPDLPQEPEGF